MTEVADKTHIERVVQELRDREDIRELLQHYCFLVDTRQAGRLVDEVYTDDAEDLHCPHTDPPFVAKGREQLAALFVDMLDGLEATQHLIANHHIELRGNDAAHSRVYLIAVNWIKVKDPAVAGGTRPADCLNSLTYDDELVRTERGWRIKRRRLHAFGPGSSLAVGWLPAGFSPGVGTQLYAPGDS
jgi:hypothetical protein